MGEAVKGGGEEKGEQTKGGTSWAPLVDSRAGGKESAEE